MAKDKDQTTYVYYPISWQRANDLREAKEIAKPHYPDRTEQEASAWSLLGLAFGLNIDPDDVEVMDSKD